MKYSKQREIIYDALKHVNTHPSADELYEMLKPEHESLSLGTVYRNLRQMSKNGMIREIASPGNKDRFDADLSSHQHFFCMECGKVFDVFLPEADNSSEVGKKYGFEVVKSEHSYYGICSDCSEKAN